MPDRLRFPKGAPRAAVARAALIAALATTAAAQPEPAALADLARQAMAERRFAAAAEAYGQLAKKFPGEPTLLANLGMALHLSGQDRAAIKSLRAATDRMPAAFAVHFYLGASLSRLGEYGEAVEPLRDAVRLDDRHPFSKALLGDALESIGKALEAAEQWRALAALEDGNPYAYAGQVRCYEQLAARAFEVLRGRAPESAYVLRLLARARLEAAQYPSALYLFRQALAAAPGSREVHEAVAEVYERTGRADWAAVERERAAALPEPACESSGATRCTFREGRYDALPTFPSSVSDEEAFWTARSYSAMADRAYEKLLAVRESVDQLRLVTGLLAEQQQYPRAIDACRRALELRPADGTLERQLAELLYLAGRGEEARPLLERFREANARDPRWPAMLGRLLVNEQDYDQAIPLLEASAALPGPPASVRLDLGRSYVAVGKPEQAVDHLRAALDADTDGSVHYQLAQAYQRLGRRDEARDALARYRTLDARARRSVEESASLEITPPE